MSEPEANAALHKILEEYCSAFIGKVTVVCALESRGFLFGPQIALQLKVPFVPIRKKGKLPGEVKQAVYELEYGTVRHLLISFQNFTEIKLCSKLSCF